MGALGTVMGRPSKEKIEKIKRMFSWLNSEQYKSTVKDVSDFDLVRALFDRYHVYQQAKLGNQYEPYFSYFQKIVEGNIFPEPSLHGYFFDKSACNDFGYLEKAKEISESKFIEPLSANHILCLKDSIPYEDDFHEHTLKGRSFFAYTYKTAFKNMFCLNIDSGATNAQILSELEQLLPKLRRAYNKPPLIKQLSPKIRKLREMNMLALFDFLIYWEFQGFGQLLAPIICEVIYDQRAPDDIKDLELKSAFDLLDGDSRQLILMGRFLQQTN